MASLFKQPAQFCHISYSGTLLALYPHSTFPFHSFFRRHSLSQPNRGTTSRLSEIANGSHALTIWPISRRTFISPQRENRFMGPRMRKF